MKLNGVKIENTFAEAFPMVATRVLITACNKKWVRHATDSITGFATSVIACGIEAGVENLLTPEQTPDGRAGASVLIFSMSANTLKDKLRDRIGQCVLTSPTSAVYSGMDNGTPLALGNSIRYFGDGYQISKKMGAKRFWRIPVMDGEFICEDTTHRVDAIGGGNLLIIATDIDTALKAAERAVKAISKFDDVITPFPGGVVRSGSKVGSKYEALIASTNDAYCPTLRGLVDSRLPDNAGAVLEIVIDGLTRRSISDAMKGGIKAACETENNRGVIAISASNFGGKLGKHHFHLHEVLN